MTVQVQVNSEVWPTTSSTDLRKIDPSEFNEPCKYVLCKKMLGDGSFSTVYECKNLATGLHYAVKLYSKKMVYGLEDMLQNEFQILKTVSMTHANILTLIDYFETKDTLYLVTDLALGGELYDRIINHPNGKLDEPEVSKITSSIVSTLHYLHLNHIVHRDLKAENLLFQSKKKNSNILLADFGLARILKNKETLHDSSGTLSYMAPEMFTRDGHSFPVDIWALGVLVYFMLCGYMPFDCDNDDETKQTIMKNDYVFDPPEYWDHISDDAKDFVSSCFTLDPKTRHTAHDLLRHPFVNGEDSGSSSYSSNMSLSRRHNSSNISLTNVLKESVVRLQLKQQQQLQPLVPTKSQNHSNYLFQDHTSNIHRSLLATRIGLDGHSSTHPSRVLSATHLNSLLSPSHLNSNLSRLNSSHQLSSLSSKLSLLERSRNVSLMDGVTSRGAMCESPDQVSQFTTPINSAVGSREQSYNNMSIEDKPIVDLKNCGDGNTSAKFFI